MQVFTSTSRFQREVQFVCDSHFMQLATYYMRQTFVSIQHNWLYDEFSIVCMLIFSFGVSRRVVVNLEVVVWVLTQDYTLIRHKLFLKMTLFVSFEFVETLSLQRNETLCIQNLTVIEGHRLLSITFDSPSSGSKLELFQRGFALAS